MDESWRRTYWIHTKMYGQKVYSRGMSWDEINQGSKFKNRLAPLTSKLIRYSVWGSLIFTLLPILLITLNMSYLIFKTSFLHLIVIHVGSLYCSCKSNNSLKWLYLRMMTWYMMIS